MAFNKAKVLEAAQKYLNQGKLPQAIKEYEQLLRHEPEDQITLMTIGDLYVRAGDIQQGMTYFERLAQLFINDGFISKSIAIYKKIAKLAPAEIAPLERLAELYVQQGVMSEARPIYLQLAEAHLKGNRNAQAIEILKKLLDLAPDNLRVQIRLAELYQTIGQEKEAATAYLSAAYRLLDKGEFDEARKMAEKALTAEPKNPRAVSVKARAMAAAGQHKEAIALLEKLPQGAGSETTSLLTELYMQVGQVDRSIGLARKAMEQGPEQYGMVYGVATGLLDGGEPDRALQLLDEIRGKAVEAGDTERLVQALGTAVERMPGRLEPLAWLADTYRSMGDSFRLPEALENLAQASIAAGDTARARAAYAELVERDPENENYKLQLKALDGGGAVAVAEAATEEIVPFEEIEAVPEAEAVPAAEAPLDEETERFLTQALTDVDLFSSYGLNQKGIDLLESVLQRAPKHTGAMEKLLDLYMGAGNERRTAEIAERLEHLYLEKGDHANADKFAELCRRFNRAAGRTADQVAAAAQAAAPPAEFTIPMAEVPAEVEAAPVEAPAAPQPAESEAHEMDLSAEWAAITESTEAPAESPAPDVPEARAEIEISLDEEIPVAEVEAAPAEAAAEPVPEAAAGEWGTEAAPVEASAEASVPPVVEPEPVPAAPVAESPAQPGEAFAEISDELEQQAPAQQEAAAPVETVEYDFEVAAAPAESSASRSAEPAAAGPMSSDQFLSDLGAEISDLEIATPKAAPPAKEKKKSRKDKVAEELGVAPPAKKESVEQLREVFDEFKADMGEIAEEEAEDLETHYNLGIAYREMGLLEEAIGEFQKVGKAIQSGRPFRYAMQCYTLLGLAFMDKGQPKIAAIWYDRALMTPDLDAEAVMAVRYDLGVAQELAGDRKAALDNFNQVYAMNIDYRDVAERIAALQKRD